MCPRLFAVCAVLGSLLFYHLPSAFAAMLAALCCRATNNDGRRYQGISIQSIQNITARNTKKAFKNSRRFAGDQTRQLTGAANVLWPICLREPSFVINNKK